MATGRNRRMHFVLLAATFLLAALPITGAPLEKLRGSNSPPLYDAGPSTRSMQGTGPQTDNMSSLTSPNSEVVVKPESEKQKTSWPNHSESSQEGENTLLIVGDMFQQLSSDELIKDQQESSGPGATQGSTEQQHEQAGDVGEESIQDQSGVTNATADETNSTTEQENSDAGEEESLPSTEEVSPRPADSGVPSDKSTASDIPSLSEAAEESAGDESVPDSEKLEEELVAELAKEAFPADASAGGAQRHRALQEIPYYLQYNPLAALGRSKYRVHHDDPDHHSHSHDIGENDFIKFRQNNSVSRGHSSEDEEVDADQERGGEGTVVEEMGKAIVSLFLGTEIPSHSDSSDDSDSDDSVPHSQVHHHYYSNNQSQETPTSSSTPAPAKPTPYGPHTPHVPYQPHVSHSSHLPPPPHVPHHPSTQVPPAHTSSPARNCFECDIDYFGYDVEKIETGVPDLLACQRRCQRHPMCDFFTYSEQWHGCYLKHSRREKLADKEKILVSGLKYCNNAGSILCHQRVIHWTVS